MVLEGSPGTSMCRGAEKVKGPKKRENKGEQEIHKNPHRGNSLPHTKRKSGEIRASDLVLQSS